MNGDSSRHRVHWVVTPRVNSAGHFPFTGSLVNRHINADVNVFFTYGSWGGFVFKSHDLQQKNSLVNYLQPGVFRTFTLNPSLSVRLFFGYVFSQRESFRDSGSDFYVAPILYWTISPNLKLENCSLFFDLKTGSKLANRLVLLWTVASFRVEFLMWHRWALEEARHATSGSVAIVLPDLRLSRAAAISTTVSYQGYLSETKPAFAVRDGFLLSIAFPIRRSR